MPDCLWMQGPKEFLAVIIKGHRRENSYLQVKHLPADDLRFGLTVSGKIGDAVRRNRLKRRLREIVRVWTPQTQKKSGWFIIRAKKGVTNLKFGELQESLLELLTWE